MFREKPNEVIKGQETLHAQARCTHDLRPDLNQGCCTVGGIVRHPINFSKGDPPVYYMPEAKPTALM